MGAGPSRNDTHEIVRRHEEQMRQQHEAAAAAEQRHREEREAMQAEQRRREEEERRRWEETQRQMREQHEREAAEIRRMAEEAERRAAEDRERAEATMRKMAEDERLRNEAERERLRQEQERQRLHDEAERERLRVEQERQLREAQERHAAEQARLEREAEERRAAEKAAAEARLAEQQRRADEEKALLEAQRKEMESRLLAGIQPEVWPTSEERANAERILMQPPGEYFHCAVAGTAGSGKSSLINALRGLKNSDKSPLTARTGETETTLEIGRYQHPLTEQPWCRFVWYDIPGAGTMKVSGWQYFNKQGLFVFDLIVVVVGDRLTQLDITILEHCQRYKIPSLIVRSKANQYISNCMANHFNWDSDDDEDERDFNEVYQQARRMYTEGTRRNFRETLREQNLDATSKIYIVSNIALFALINGKHAAMKKWNQCIDEAAFVEDLSRTIKARRLAKPNENGVMPC